MNFHIFPITILNIMPIYMCGITAVSIKPELKCNVLKFGYGVNVRYEGMSITFI